MIINDVILNADCEEIIAELQRQLAVNQINLLQRTHDAGRNIQVQCPYHGNGQERRPSAGIRKEDGLFHCFRGDTKVITYEYGAVEMKSIVDVPVHILNGNGIWEEVTFRNYGKQSLMKLTLSCNTKQKIIYATPEHEWLLKRGNKKYQTQYLKSGMYLRKCIPQMRDIKLDEVGIMHGFCYGDGNNYAHYKNKYYHKCFFYNENDLELKQYFTGAKFNKGIAGNGKEYEFAYFTSDENFKEVPSMLHSDEYLMGFLAGYFVADGNCCRNKLTIYSHKYDDLYKIQQICTRLGIMSTEIGVANIKAGNRGCVTVKQDTHGYILRLVRNTIQDSFFITSKGRESYQKYTSKNAYKVISVETTDYVEDVYCCQTSTHSFALEHFILTGNCFACGQAHTLPEVISYCFGHYEDVLGKFGMNWLITNFATIRKEERKDVEIDMERNNSTSKNTRLEHIASFEPNFVTEEELDSYRYYHSYWTDRGIVDENIIELFDLGYDIRTNCITFPVRDIDGNCLFVARRNVATKWFNYPKDVEKPLYGLYEFKSILEATHELPYQINTYGAVKSVDPDKLYITESMIDCILLWQAGKYAVALNGTGSKEQLEVLKKLPIRHYVLATDNDEAGQKAREKLRKALPNKLITEIDFPENRKDIGECTKEEIENIEQWEVF